MLVNKYFKVSEMSPSLRFKLLNKIRISAEEYINTVRECRVQKHIIFLFSYGLYRKGNEFPSHFLVKSSDF